MLRHIPNFLTCCNLISGCLGIVFLLEGRGVPAAWFVWASCVFDFFDGFAARALKVHSPIGKELDSLADMVSFGVLPAVVMYLLLKEAAPLPWLPFVAFLIATFSALRLAIFNIDETQRDSFKGLPTPANAIFITSLPLLPVTWTWLFTTPALLVITLVFSLMLVSRINLFALKFKSYSWAENKVRFTFLALSVLLIATLNITALPIIILVYIGLSLAIHLFPHSNKKG